MFLDIYLAWTLSTSAHSNKLKPTKTPKHNFLGFLKKIGLTQQKPPGWAF